MSLFATLDWDQIKEPLPGQERCGADLQYDAAYDYIRLARQAEAEALPAGVWERPAKKVDWEDVGKRCFEFLTQRSKDLQVAAWMTEAFYHADGLQGVSRGVGLFSDMAQLFWSDVHPRIEDDDVELRLRPVNWLLAESLVWFDRTAPVEMTTKGGNSAYWDALKNHFLQLDSFIFEQLKDDAPNFRDLHTTLQALWMASMPNTKAAQDEASTSSSDNYNSRDMAYAQLREIASFLAQVEPHSPVPMVLNALVQWRSASFEDLLARLPEQGGSSVYELLKLFKPDAVK